MRVNLPSLQCAADVTSLWYLNGAAIPDPLRIPGTPSREIDRHRLTFHKPIPSQPVDTKSSLLAIGVGWGFVGCGDIAFKRIDKQPTVSTQLSNG